MRVVSGKFRGRRLNAVPGMATRPTTDKVKESLFNIIGPYFDGGQSLDLYGGSGGLSIEAVSRGVEHAFIVDRQYAAIKTIKQNVGFTHCEQQFTVLKQDAHKALHIFAEQEKQFDLVFLDPPYAKQQIVKDIQMMVDQKLLKPDALVVCETNQEADLPIDLTGFQLFRQHEYGITVLTIYQYQGEHE
ncbi:RNA methyltransferase, RsmD family [Limosilactobacillus coleohominis 101-4-CHN]|uniref:RNA methyltransferase, RsmD family n=1 Tax=Limosilactobacillus coleohominis 101-4-CHN TaxID=575594 RepID=C7XTG1_9LACO|nr:16S rRNA (guanine(966)-N(2))-methyltransferase RsmD [Limosilactobacillus coleohominis]EEU30641.1 RNA methyltransferase, RsmD family [Limosilactobacillus coleohominis 101-4-CHN]